MEKTVPAFEARRQFGKILREVLSNGDRFVVERHGDAVAAIVPIEVYREWQASRRAFFDRVRAAAEQADMPPDEAATAAAKAVHAVRSADIA